MTATVNLEDTAYAFVRHEPDGERYAVQYASVWHGDTCTGATIIYALGPLYRQDTDLDELVPNIDDGILADWLNDEDAAHNLYWEETTA